jgi:hypothetical protein
MSHIDPGEGEDEPSRSQGPRTPPDSPGGDAAKATPALQPLDEGDRQVIASLVAEGRNVVGAGPSAEPRDVAGSVNRWLSGLKREKRSPTGEHLAAAAVAYGDALASVTGWRWNLYLESGREYLALASPDASHVHLPVEFMSGQITAMDEVTALLLFNMLAAGQRPDARPGELRVIG